MATIDLEGAEALRELKLFEKNKCKKQPNRYAKAHLEAYLTRDETMGARIKTRTQLTQAKMESNIDVGGMIFNVFFECVFVLICHGFLEAPKVENRAPVETKR